MSTLISYDGIVATVRDVFPDGLIVPNLGTNTAALMHNGERDEEFYMWGAMGMVHSIGLGLALTAPHRTVVVLDGDGSLLMGMAGMSTIGAAAPPNLLHVLVDNQAWGNTGGQPTHTARGVDPAIVARGCGYRVVERAEDEATMRAHMEGFARQPELTFLHLKVGFLDIPRPPEDPDPIGIKTRFMRACRASR